MNENKAKEALEEANKSLVLNSEQEQAVKSALTAGYGIAPNELSDGGALKVESLDPDIKNQSYGANDWTIYPHLVG